MGGTTSLAANSFWNESSHGHWPAGNARTTRPAASARQRPYPALPRARWPGSGSFVIMGSSRARAILPVSDGRSVPRGGRRLVRLADVDHPIERNVREDLADAAGRPVDLDRLDAPGPAEPDVLSERRRAEGAAARHLAVAQGLAPV